MDYDHIKYNDLSNFLLRGFCVFENANLISKFKEIEDYKIEDCNVLDCDNLEDYIPKKILHVLKDVQNEIGIKYITKLFDNWIPTQVGMWDGVDDGSRQWHNDKGEGDGVDCNFLFYFDDMSPEVGGALYVRGPHSQHKIYPKRDMLIWINQSQQFYHKADEATTQRRLASFEYLLPKL
jgi:hypothetical protein